MYSAILQIDSGSQAQIYDLLAGSDDAAKDKAHDLMFRTHPTGSVRVQRDRKTIGRWDNYGPGPYIWSE